MKKGLESPHLGRRRPRAKSRTLKVSSAAAAREPPLELLLLQRLHPVPAAVGRQQLPQQREKQTVGGVVLSSSAGDGAAAEGRPVLFGVRGGAHDQRLHGRPERGHQRRLSRRHGQVDPVVANTVPPKVK